MEIQAIGGYEGVGRNMTIVREKGAQYAIDCGIKLDPYLLYYGEERTDFSKITNDELIRISAIPDFNRIKGKIDHLFISHGHLDHIGAIEKFTTKYHCQITGLPYSTGLVSRRLKKNQKDRLKSAHYRTPQQVGQGATAQFVEVTHSIPDSSFVSIEADKSMLYACDFKLDDHSNIAKVDYATLKKIGKSGLDALVVESLYSGREGKTPSERIARANLHDIVGFAHDSSNLIVATTFSTHIERLNELVEEATNVGREVMILGRSFVANCEMGEKRGLLNLPKDARVIGSNYEGALKNVARERHRYMVIATGHQGEPDSVLSRIANREFRFDMKSDDALIFASDVIPTDTNVANRSQLEEKLRAFKVRIFADAHVSGHASREEHRKLIKTLNPEKIIPAHGDIRMIGDYVTLAEEEGYRLGRDVFVMRNGSIVRI